MSVLVYGEVYVCAYVLNMYVYCVCTCIVYVYVYVIHKAWIAQIHALRITYMLQIRRCTHMYILDSHNSVTIGIGPAELQ